MGLKRSSERLLLQRLAWLSLGLLLATPMVSVAQDDAPLSREERLSDPVYMSWIGYEPVSKCVSCHVLGPSEADIDSGRSGQLTSFSRQSEMMYWLRSDKHTIARRRIEPFAEQQSENELNRLYDRLDKQIDHAIAGYKRRGETVDRSQVGLESVPEEWIGESNILSRRMCDKLWGPGSVTTPAGYAKFRDNCLTCHAGYQAGASGFDLADLDQARLGIDCLYCHQLGDNSDWVAPHQLPEKWRLLPPEQKEAAGLRALVGTSNQANLCFDCHVGNRSKNMFVSHEMYAAGHPPIPSIELQQFCQEMPQHWQSPSQLYKSLKNYEGRDEYFQKNYPGLLQTTTADKVFWNTRKMLVGALAARKKSLDLIIESANAHLWADYSLYDCAACHHELQSASYRQLRGFPGAPGRPRQHEWPDAILTIAYRFYGGGGQQGRQVWAKMRQMESQLTAQFSEQPFGDPDRVRPVAEALRSQVVAAIEMVERTPVDARIANGVLLGLSRTPEDKLVTYDAARQVVWAMQTIVEELAAEGLPVNEQVAAIVKSLGEPATAGIETKIPSGRKTFIYPKGLEADLQRRADFSPARLQMRLNQINQMLVAMP